MTNTLLAVTVCQGTVVSRSILLPAPQTRAFTAAALLAAADQADPSFAVLLMLQASLEPGFWRPVATVEWQGGPKVTAPSVTWTGLARRVRLLIDLSRPASLGATLDC